MIKYGGQLGRVGLGRFELARVPISAILGQFALNVTNNRIWMGRTHLFSPYALNVTNNRVFSGQITVDSAFALNTINSRTFNGQRIRYINRLVMHNVALVLNNNTLVVNVETEVS